MGIFHLAVCFKNNFAEIYVGIYSRFENPTAVISSSQKLIKKVISWDA